MKLDIKENDYFFSISIKPETIAEAALLLRLAAQTKREPIKFFTDFSQNDIYLTGHFNKKKNKLDFITNQTKEK